jgi:hypothetical protein
MAKRESPVDLGPDLALLASKLAKRALDDKVTALDKLDIFKALTTYYVNTTKVSVKIPTEGDGEGSIHDFRKRIAAATGGPGSGTPRDTAAE